jgi:hypothetical protein
MDAFYVVALSRATNEPGAVPASIVDVSRAAEREFARAAHRDLGRLIGPLEGALGLRSGEVRRAP